MPTNLTKLSPIVLLGEPLKQVWFMQKLNNWGIRDVIDRETDLLECLTSKTATDLCQNHKIPKKTSYENPRVH